MSVTRGTFATGKTICRQWRRCKSIFSRPY